MAGMNSEPKPDAVATTFSNNDYDLSLEDAKKIEEALSMRNLNLERLAAITKMGKMRMRLESIALTVGTLAWNQDAMVGLINECKKMQDKCPDDPKLQAQMIRMRGMLHKNLIDATTQTAKMEFLAAASARKEEHRRVQTAKQFRMIIPIIENDEQRKILTEGIKAQREIDADAARDMPPDGEGQERPAPPNP